MRQSVAAMAALLVAACASNSSTPEAMPRTASLRDAAESISSADVRRRIDVIAHDSMEGRFTPSRGLDKTAAWVAAEFQRFGLAPGGDGGTYLQRYPIVASRLDLAKARLNLAGPGPTATSLDMANDAVALTSGAEAGRVDLVAVGGPLEGADLTGLGLAGKGVVLAVPAGAENTLTRASRTFRGLGVPLIVVVPQDGAVMQRLASFRTRSDQRPASTPSGTSVVVVPAETLARTAPDVAAAVEAVRGATTPTTRALAGWTGEAILPREVLSEEHAPNTIGVLEGSDPVLKKEYVVLTAHMDHVGTTAAGQCRARGADSICNGADDDASGTVGLVEVAEAMSRPGARPRRSVIFMTVSGEERGLWGSAWYADHPTVPVGQIVANINLDMIGRNWPDTIVAIGKEHSDLGATLNRVNAAHPELGMTAIDDIWPEERFYFRSDHYNFARKGVPVLFFFNGVHEDYHQATDSPDKINTEKLARIAQLVFYLTEEVANADARPEWRKQSYAEIVEGPGGR